MTTHAEQAYLDSRMVDPELEEMNARFNKAREEEASEAAEKVAREVEQHAHDEGEEDEHGEHGEEEGHEEEGHEGGEHEEGHEEHGHEEEGDGHVGMHRHKNVKLDPKTPLWLQLWGAVNNPKRLTTNALAGLYDAAKALGNTVIDTVDKASEFTYPMSGLAGEESLLEEMDVDAARGRREVFEKTLAGAPRPRLGGEETPTMRDELAEVFPELAESADHLRESIAKESNSGDVMVQKTMQFTVPFVATLRMMQFGKTATGAGKVGKAVLADMITNATVWDPHEARFGELLRLFESQVPEEDPVKPATSRAVGLLAPYIDYVSATADEGEWEGRWKNAVDSTVMNAALAPFFFAAGVALKGMMTTSRSVIDTANEMRRVLSGMRAGSRGPVATIEIYSSKSPAGQQLELARTMAGRYGDTRFEKELVDAQLEGMAVASQNHTFSKLVEAVTGLKSTAHGTQIPPPHSPFDFSGTFEGGLTPNARVPLLAASDNELAQMNAIIGKEWDQDAMVASDIRPVTSWKQKPAKGYQRGLTVFVTEPATDPRALAVKVRAEIPPEHEFSIRAVNGGYVVDVFPFPNALNEGDALRIANALGDKAEAIPHDYRSVYTTRDQYDSVLEGLDGEAAQRAGDQGADGVGAGAAGGDLLTAARQELRLAKTVYERHALAAAARLEDRVNRSGVPPAPSHERHTAQREFAEEEARLIDEDIAFETMGEASERAHQHKKPDAPKSRHDENKHRERRAAEEAGGLKQAFDEFGRPKPVAEGHPDNLEGAIPPHKPNWHGHRKGDKGEK